MWKAQVFGICRHSPKAGLALVVSHWFAANCSLEVSVKITLACGIHEMCRVRNMQAEGNIFL